MEQALLLSKSYKILHYQYSDVRSALDEAISGILIDYYPMYVTKQQIMLISLLQGAFINTLTFLLNYCRTFKRLEFKPYKL